MISETCKVIVYDPKIFYRTFIADTLEKEGYEVFVAETIKMFVPSVNELMPDVVLLDLSELKERDTDFLMALKKSYPTLPVITLLDADKKEYMVRYIKAGVFDCVAKPVIREELLLTVKKAKEFTRYKKEENLRLGKLKRFAHGSEKILGFVKEKQMSLPKFYPNDRLIQSILDSIAQVLDASSISISWLSPDKKTYQVIASAGHNLDVKLFKPRAVGEGIVGYVASQKESIHVVDILTDKRFKTSSFRDQYKSGSFLSGPIIISGDVVGVLNVSDRRDGKPFSEEDFLLFKTFLLQITYAAEGGLIIKALEENNARLEIYKEISKHIVNLVEAGDILNRILQTITVFLKATGSCLFILDENREFFINEGGYGLKFKNKVTFVKSHEELLEHIFSEKDKSILKLIKVFVSSEDIETFCSVPVKLKNYPLGFLVVINCSHQLIDEILMEDLGMFVSVAFKNNWLYKNLCVVADELVKANRELEELTRKKQPGK